MKHKIKQYSSAVEDCRGHFSPFVVTTDGVFAKEANFFLKRLATGLTTKWEKPYPEGWVHRRLQFAIVKATKIYRRDFRMKWRGLGVKDGGHIELNNLYILFIFCKIITI